MQWELLLKPQDLTWLLLGVLVLFVWGRTLYFSLTWSSPSSAVRKKWLQKNPSFTTAIEAAFEAFQKGRFSFPGVLTYLTAFCFAVSVLVMAYAQGTEFDQQAFGLFVSTMFLWMFIAGFHLAANTTFVLLVMKLKPAEPYDVSQFTPSKVETIAVRMTGIAMMAASLFLTSCFFFEIPYSFAHVVSTIS